MYHANSSSVYDILLLKPSQLFAMESVRRYFCCTDNITGCQILGGFWVTLIAFFSIFTIVELKLQHITNPASILVVLMIIVVSLSFAILLVIAAVERNSTLLKTWMVFNGILILLTMYEILNAYFCGPHEGFIQAMIILLSGFGLVMWTELVAYGAYQEVRSGPRIWAIVDQVYQEVNSEVGIA